MALTDFERSVLGDELSDLSDRLDAEKADRQASEAAAAVSDPTEVTTTTAIGDAGSIMLPRVFLPPPIIGPIPPTPSIPFATPFPVGPVPLPSGFVDDLVRKITGPIDDALDAVQTFLAKLFGERIRPLAGGIQMVEDFVRDLSVDLFSGINQIIRSQDGILANIVSRIEDVTGIQIRAIIDQADTRSVSS